MSQPINNPLQSIIDRRDGLEEWCKDQPCLADHKHLDDGTPERAYWHAGYLSALKDVLEYVGAEKVKQ